MATIQLNQWVTASGDGIRENGKLVQGQSFNISFNVSGLKYGGDACRGVYIIRASKTNGSSSYEVFCTDGNNAIKQGIYSIPWKNTWKGEKEILIRMWVYYPNINHADTFEFYIPVTTNTASPTMPTLSTYAASIAAATDLALEWSASTDADNNMAGYILERSLDDSAFEEIYRGTARTYADSVPFGSSTVQYRVCAYDSEDEKSTYSTGVLATVINNRAPQISGSDTDIGAFSLAAPSYTYSVTDEDGDEVTVVEAIDGKAIKSRVVTLGQQYAVTLTSAEWTKVLNGSHELTITATDAAGAKTVRTLTFTKSVTSIELVTTPLPADAMPTLATLNVQGAFPAGSVLTASICNNASDVEPTWEPVMESVLKGSRVHNFTNTTKTAGQWAVGVKVILSRGTADGACFISSFGGAFK